MRVQYAEYHSHALSSKDQDLAQSLAANLSEKQLLAFILMHLGHIEGRLGQIEGRLFEPTFMENRELSKAELDIVDERPEIAKSGFQLLMDQLKEINQRLSMIQR